MIYIPRTKLPGRTLAKFPALSFPCEVLGNCYPPLDNRTQTLNRPSDRSFFIDAHEADFKSSILILVRSNSNVDAFSLDYYTGVQ